MIIVKKLVKLFGLKTVLRGVDFDVQPGEFVVLLGPERCGENHVPANLLPDHAPPWEK